VEAGRWGGGAVKRERRSVITVDRVSTETCMGDGPR